MAGFSGLVDGTHTFDINDADGTGAGYTQNATTDAALAELNSSIPKPAVAGLARVLMQKRGMYGHVNALGRNTVTAITQVKSARSNVDNVRGTFDYAAWKADPTTGELRDIDLLNHGDDLNVLATNDNTTPVIPDDAREADMVAVYDTTVNEEYAGDAAMTGVTATPLARRNPT